MQRLGLGGIAGGGRMRSASIVSMPGQRPTTANPSSSVNIMDQLSVELMAYRPLNKQEEKTMFMRKGE